jgi:exopolysaccharide production protein ExoQ
MPKELALLICVALILWLFARDHKLRPLSSWELWIPFTWVLIIGSRPVSYWFSGGAPVQTMEDYLDGSPLDRTILLALIVLGFYVLYRRGIDWGKMVASNRWFFAFFLYCGLSVIWSDFPLTAFKRFIKEVGNVIMVLIVVTEDDSIEATRAIFTRYTYVAVPLSVVFIKYFPDIGRYYHKWTWKAGYCGIGTEKNSLGAIAMISCLFMLYDVVEMVTQRGAEFDRTDLFCRVALISMALWLLSLAQSSTSTVCLILGAGLYLMLRFDGVRGQVKYLGTYSLMMGVLALLVILNQDILEGIVGIVERDVTMTGRSIIWESLLKISNESDFLSQLLGSGFDSFWLTNQGQSYHAGLYYLLNQAHNGYLETYLNLGAIGLSLLAAVIVATGIRLKWNVLAGNAPEALFLSLFFVALVYNWTEAMFNKLSPMWMMFIICALRNPVTAEIEARQDMDTR